MYPYKVAGIGNVFPLAELPNREQNNCEPLSSLIVVSISNIQGYVVCKFRHRNEEFGTVLSIRVLT